MNVFLLIKINNWDENSNKLNMSIVIKWRVELCESVFSNKC